MAMASKKVHAVLDVLEQRVGRRWVFDRAPMLVYWEITRACDLACVHCRAEAVVRRNPLELSTEEGKALLRQVAAFC